MKNILSFSAAFLITISVFSQQPDIMIPYRAGLHWGFSDPQGKIMIKPVYDSVTLFSERVSSTENTVYSKAYLNGNAGIIDKSNVILLPFVYKKITETDQNLLFIVETTNQKTGVIGFGREVIPVEYDGIKEIAGYHYLLKKDKKAGIADGAGKIVIPVSYNQIDYVSSEGTLYKWKAVSDTETKYIETQKVDTGYDYDQSIGAGPETMGDEDDFATDTEALKKKYDQVIPDKEYPYGCIINKARKYGFVNLKSKNIIKPSFEMLGFLEKYKFEENNYYSFFLLMKQSGKWGLVDEKGNIAANAIYDKIYKNGGDCTLLLNNLQGYYFPKTNILFEPKFKGSRNTEMLYSADFKQTFKIIAVYESQKRDWYYIGGNGVTFKE